MADQYNFHQIIFPGRVVDNQDKQNLGRLRIYPESQDVDAIKNSVQNFSEKDYWTERDPFLYLPLLPIFINQVPMVGEYVHIIKYDKKYEFRNQFYIAGPISSPMKIAYENYTDAKKFLAFGDRFKEDVSIKDDNGNYVNKKIKGVFPEPEHISIQGRGPVDLILKGNEVLLRAGTTKSLKPGVLPFSNANRGFLQISNFTNTTKKGKTETSRKTQIQSKYLSKLVEWTILNPENQSDSFTGNISIYNLSGTSLTTDKVYVDSDIKNSILLLKFDFTSLTFEEASTLINQVIRGVNSGFINIPGYQTYTFAENSQFPFYFRPSTLTYKNLVDFSATSVVNSVIEQQNISLFMTKIKLIDSSTTGGYGLVWTKDKLGPGIDIITEKVQTNETKNTPQSIATLGSQKIFLLSQDMVIKSKGKISFEDNIYGISQTDYDTIIMGKTDPMVRGEQLMELINLIVKFLVSHVHGYHGLAPVQTGVDGTTVNDILQKLLDAPNNILNQNIRIN